MRKYHTQSQSVPLRLALLNSVDLANSQLALIYALVLTGLELEPFTKNTNNRYFDYFEMLITVLQMKVSILILSTLVSEI